MRKLAWLVILVAFIPGIAGALGIGALKSDSALNEPFRASIELTGVSGDEIDGIQVGLASPEAFARAGIERPYFLTRMRFKVVRGEDGKAYLRITTKEPVKEPFLHFLLEVNWPKGRLLREYTVLLDPPLYQPQSPVLSVGAEEAGAGGTPVKGEHVVQHFESRGATPAPSPASRGGTGRMTANGILVGEHDTLWSIASHNLPDPSVSVQQMMLALLRANPEAFLADNVNALKAGYILHLPPATEARAIDRRQALEIIRRHNAEWQQYRQQIAAGTAHRAEGAPASHAGGAAVTAAGEGEARLELVSPRRESAAGTEAVAGAASGAGGGSLMGEEVAVAAERMASAEAEIGELRRQLQQSEEVIELLKRKIELRDQELAALQAKLAGMGQELPPKLAAEAGQMPAGEPLETGVGGTPVPVEHVVQTFEMPSGRPAAGEETVSTAGEQAPAGVQEAPAPVPGAEQPAAAAPEAGRPATPQAGRTVFGYPLPGWLDGVVDPAIGMLELLIPASALALVPGGGLTVLGILVLILLLLLALILRALLRPKQVGVQLPPSVSRKESPAGEAAETVAAAEAVTEVPEAGSGAAPTTIEASQEAGLTEQTVPGGEAASAVAEEAAEVEPEPEEDPLAEVNVYLAYERFDQAAELVKKVIAEHPDEPKYRLRLLEVYYSANDKKAYEEAARELYEAVNGEGELWDSAVAMWNEMSPTRALFEEGGAEEPGTAAAGAAAGVSMLDLSGESGDEKFAAEETATVAPGETAGEGLDIELAGPAEEVAGPEGGGAATAEEGFLDLTAPEEGESAGEILDLTAAAETEAGSDVLDITAESEEQETESLELSGGESAGSDLLDLTAEGESGEDLLDLTGGEEFAGEGDILDVTAGGDIEEVEAEDLLDVTNIAPPPGAAEEEAGAPAPPTEEADENLVEFDLGGIADKAAASEAETAETGGTEGGLEFDISELTAGAAEEEPQGGAGEEEPGEALDFSLDLGEEAGAGREDSPEGDVGGKIPETEEAAGEALDFSLDLGEEPEAGGTETAETGEEAAEGAGEALDLSLDLDTGPTVEEEEPGAGPDFEATTTEAPGGGEVDLSGPEEGLDFDLGLEEEPPAGETTGTGEEMLDLTLEGEGQGPEAELGESLEELAQSLEEAGSGGEGAAEEFGGLDLEIEGEAEEPLVEGLETMQLEPETPAPEEMEDQTVVMPRGDEVEEQSEEDEIDTRLNLAKAYIELGDNEGARAILEEVRQGGSEEQVRQAEELLKQVE